MLELDGLAAPEGAADEVAGDARAADFEAVAPEAVAEEALTHCSVCSLENIITGRLGGFELQGERSKRGKVGV